MTSYIFNRDPLAIAAYKAIYTGDLQMMKQLLAEHETLSTARFTGNPARLTSPTLLHLITDWPGYFPNGAFMVELILKACGDVNVHSGALDNETPLHWAASCNDVEVIDALLDGGADIEILGSCIGGRGPA